MISFFLTIAKKKKNTYLTFRQAALQSDTIVAMWDTQHGIFIVPTIPLP